MMMSSKNFLYIIVVCLIFAVFIESFTSEEISSKTSTIQNVKALTSKVFEIDLLKNIKPTSNTNKKKQTFISIRKKTEETLDTKSDTDKQIYDEVKHKTEKNDPLSVEESDFLSNKEDEKEYEDSISESDDEFEDYQDGSKDIHHDIESNNMEDDEEVDILKSSRSEFDDSEEDFINGNNSEFNNRINDLEMDLEQDIKEKNESMK